MLSVSVELSRLNSKDGVKFEFGLGFNVLRGGSFDSLLRYFARVGVWRFLEDSSTLAYGYCCHYW